LILNVDGKSTKYRDYYHDCNNDDDTLQGGQGGFQEEMDVSHNLDERQPLTVVPLPFASDWFNKGIIPLDTAYGSINDANKLKEREEEKSKHVCKKRDRDDDDEIPPPLNEQAEGQAPASTTNTKEEEVVETSRKQQRSIAATDNTPHTSEVVKDGTFANSNHSDWWPKGYMKSDVHQCPILAKVYYNDDEQTKEERIQQQQTKQQHHRQRRLRLNDVVELIGVVSMDPMDADFTEQEKQKRKQDQQEQSSSGNGVTNFENWWNDTQQQDLLLDDDRLVLPPPSLLPRFHVLCYKVLDLDSLSFKFAHSNSNGTKTKKNDEQEKDFINRCTSLQNQTIRPKNNNANKEEDGEEENDRTLTINTFAKFIFCDNKYAAEALLMTLLSMAQREEKTNKKDGGNLDQNVIKTPSDTTLGCASINFTLPNVSSCKTLEKRMHRVLSEVVPIVGTATLSLAALQDQSIVAPTKSQEGGGRLTPSVMQLPKGSAFMIQQGCMAEGTIDINGQRSLMALSSLTAKHTLPYRFHGMLDYNFEADYRVIVLSSKDAIDDDDEPATAIPASDKNKTASKRRRQTNDSSDDNKNKLLPCMMQMVLVSYEEGDCDMEMANDEEVGKGGCEEEGAILPPKIAQRIRFYLSRCRFGQRKNTNIALSREVVAQAEKDFVKRRVECRSRIEEVSLQCSGVQKKPHLVGEDDLHMWLTMARLQARSRIAAIESLSCDDSDILLERQRNTANIEDWKAALKLYDAMILNC